MTDFNLLVADLHDLGMNDSEIGRQVGSSQPNIRYLRTTPGAEPRYSLGVRLVKLHRKLTRQQQAA